MRRARRRADAAVPGLAVLATSRQALDVPGEVVWRVPSMAVPTHTAADRSSGRRLRRGPAVLRARRARPSRLRVRARQRGRDRHDLPSASTASRSPSSSPRHVSARWGSTRSSRARRPLPSAHRRRPHPAAPPADARRVGRLELRPARRRRAAIVQPRSRCSRVRSRRRRRGRSAARWQPRHATRSPRLSIARSCSSTTTAPARYRYLETVKAYGRRASPACGEEDATRDRHLAYFLAPPSRRGGPVGRDQSRWLVASIASTTTCAPRWIGRRRASPRTTLTDGVSLGPYWHARGHSREAQAWFARALPRRPTAPQCCGHGCSGRRPTKRCTRRRWSSARPSRAALELAAVRRRAHDARRSTPSPPAAVRRPAGTQPTFLEAAAPGRAPATSGARPTPAEGGVQRLLPRSLAGGARRAASRSSDPPDPWGPASSSPTTISSTERPPGGKATGRRRSDA